MVARVEGRVSESVVERVVGSYGGGGVKEGECDVWRVGWWWRWRGSADGAGSGDVKEATALRWWRWRRRRERGVGVGGDGDHYSSDVGSGEGGGGENGWLKGSMPINTRHVGEDHLPAPALSGRGPLPLPGRILVSLGKAPKRM